MGGGGVCFPPENVTNPSYVLIESLCYTCKQNSNIMINSCSEENTLTVISIQTLHFILNQVLMLSC